MTAFLSLGAEFKGFIEARGHDCLVGVLIRL